MKKLFLLTLLMAGVMMGVEAQNRSIGFEQYLAVCTISCEYS